MRARYAKWMYDWEDRLTSVDNNRVVRDPGMGHGVCPRLALPQRIQPGQMPARSRRNFSQTTTSESSPTATNFIPTECRRTSDSNAARCRFSALARFRTPSWKKKCAARTANFLRFTSPVRTPYPENNLVNARWFPARGRRAVVLLPHWNADAIAYTGLCKVLNMLGIAVLRLSMPYHDIRMPAEIGRADYAVSANIGRTLDAVRQGVIDIRCCLDWLEQQGYNQLGMIGTSLGSCYAFIASAHDARVRAAAFNHASTYFADVVWHGQSTRHIRAGHRNAIDLDRLRKLWLAISPMVVFRQVLPLPQDARSSSTPTTI